jgi:membrane protein
MEITRRAVAGKALERGVRAFADDGCPHVAGSIAYRVIFAIFPLTVVLAALSALVLQSTGTQGDVVDSIVRNIPLSQDGQDQMRSLLRGATGALSGLGLLGLIPLVWAASGLMGSIRYSLNKAWGVSRPRPYLQGKAFDLLFVLGAFLLLSLSLALGVGASVVRRHAPDVADRLGTGSVVVPWLLGRLVPLLLIFLAVSAAYRLLPARQPSFRDIWPSALGVAVALTVLQSSFGLYLAYINDFNALYGSLGAVIAFLYIVYLTASVFLLGAEVAAEIPRARSELEREPPTKGDAGGDTSFSEALLRAARNLVVRDDSVVDGTAPGERDGAPNHGRARGRERAGSRTW